MKDHRSPNEAVTLRALLIGIVMTLLVTIGALYSRFILHATKLAQDHLSLGVVFPFAVLCFVINPALSLVKPSWKLRRGELGVAFSMALIASTLPTYFLGKLIANITSPYYFATLENQWATFVHQYLPSWLVVSPEGNAVRWFFEGAPADQSIPWSAWTVPLFWWGSFIAALYLVSLSAVVILRKQWSEHERISYPLMQVPLAMTETVRKRVFPDFLRSYLFWIGFWIPGFVIGWNIVGYFLPMLPTIHRSFQPISFGREFPSIETNLYFVIIGFGYFIPLNISFAIWLFYLLSVLEVGFFNRLGLHVPSADVYCSGYASMGWQGMGAFIFLVLWGLWMARKHLLTVVLCGTRNVVDEDDRGELLARRTAFWLLVGSVLYMAAFLLRSGMDPLVMLVFGFGTLVVYLGITRIVAEAGLIGIRAPVIPQPFAFYLLGSATMRRKTIVALGLTYGWVSDLKSFPMPGIANAVHVCKSVDATSSRTVGAFIVAMIVGTAATFLFLIGMGYHHGAYNYGGYIFSGGAPVPYDNVVTKMRNAFGPDVLRLSFLAAGLAVMALLTFVHYRFNWWPLHPIGFAAAPAYPVGEIAFPLFIAWIVKTCILRFGGTRGFERAKPFFYGMILGYYVMAGLSFIIDMIWFPEFGHSLSLY